jgi:hypothetical protein
MSATPVNLYVDRFMQNSPNSAEEVWNATQEHSKIYTDGAQKVGLTGSEYGEFQQALLDGKAVYVRLPAHVDAMAGLHRGHPYAIKSVAVPQNTLGWKVALNDGTLVYIPQICGNLTVVHGRAVARAPKKPQQVAHVPRAVVTQGSAVEPTPVTFQPPTEVASTTGYVPTDTVAEPVFTAPAVAEGTHGSFLPFLLPIAAFVGSVSSTPSTVVPPCSQGSNLLGVCQR